MQTFIFFFLSISVRHVQGVCLCLLWFCFGNTPCREEEPPSTVAPTTVSPTVSPTACPVISITNYTLWNSTDDQGNWTFEAIANRVSQEKVGLPTFFCSDFSILNHEINTTVQTPDTEGESSGFIGWAIGYSLGDHMNENANFLLVDWKRNNVLRTPFPGCVDDLSITPQRGLAVSLIEGIPHPNEFYLHSDEFCVDPAGAVTELERAATLGDTSWSLGVTYTFTLRYTPETLAVYVEDTLQMYVTGDFSDGMLCYYMFDEIDAIWNDLSLRDISCVEDSL